MSEVTADPKANVKTVVFGDDSSPSADVAWLMMNNHEWPGWRVEVVTATMSEQLVVHATNDPEVTLHEWQPKLPREAFSESQFERVTHLTAEGDPRLVLDRKCDLLVIGPRGPGLAKALQLGSTSDWLLRHPPAPLLIARHGREIRRVLVATDGSIHAETAIDALAMLPWAHQLDVTVLAIDDGRCEPNTAIHSGMDRLKHRVASVDFLVDVGKPTNAILRRAEETNVDLVTLGTRGLTGVPRLRLGSTASAVTHLTDACVLVSCNQTAQ
jgi:nucleotide-binding universal stress UspA family protein